MVILNGLKYACETCIKGHRSSACSHTERTLFEIKKKGRPITQCEHCRALRKTRQVHVKCTCTQSSNGEKKDTSRAKLKIPAPPHVEAQIYQNSTIPTATTSQTTQIPKTSKPKANPKPKAMTVPNDKTCDCESSGKCDCSTARPIQSLVRSSPSTASSGPRTPPPTSSCCAGKRSAPSESRPQLQSTPSSDKRTAVLLEELARSVPTSSSYNAVQSHAASTAQASTSSITSSIDWNDFKAGGCSCGVACACPGCAEHTNPSTRMMTGDNCPFTCSSCTQCSNGYSATAAHLSFSGYTATSQNSTSWSASPLSNYEMWYPGHLNIYATHASESRIVQASSKCQCTTFRVPAQIVSACCGGACKCSPIIICQCAVTCCGCCDGCSCSSDGEKEEPQPRLGFAVSGERSSDLSLHSKPIENARKEPPDGAQYPRKNKRRIEIDQGLEANSGESIQLYPIAEYRPALPHSSSQVIPTVIPAEGYSEEITATGDSESLHTDRWLGPVSRGFHYKQ